MSKELLQELGQKVQKGQMSWKEASKIFNENTGESINSEALRSRYKRFRDKEETTYNNGILEITKTVIFDENTSKNPSDILKMFGYGDEWEIISWTFGKWETAIKGEGLKEQTTFRAKIKPRIKIITKEENEEIVKKVVSNIKPIKQIKPITEIKVNNSKLMMLTIADLHLGRYCNKMDTGINYNIEIAKKYFNYIINELINWQEMVKAGYLLYTIGNDFFNCDNVNGTTTKGTQLMNSCSYREMYKEGLELQINAINKILSLCGFEKIIVQLVQGNHDEMLDYTLYLTLKKIYENNEKVIFGEDYMPIQKYEFGNNLIIQQHGDINPNQLINRIPVIYGKEWSKHSNRYFITNHKHSGKKEETINSINWIQQNTIIPTDTYEYKLGFISEPKDQNIYVFDKTNGLEYTKILKLK